MDGSVMSSIVGTSTTGAAEIYNYMHKGFYATGHFWVFWSDGTNLVYSCSSDGINWSAKQTARATCPNGFCFSIWFDGTYLHYAYANAGSIYYRRGTPVSDHSISWSASEQTVTTTYNVADYPFICVDSGRYPWIGYRDYNGISHTPYVIKSDNNSGSWSTTSGFPYELTATGTTSWKVTIVPLTSLKMYVMWARDTYAGYGKLYNAGWGSSETPMADCEHGFGHCAVAYGDDVHVVYLNDSLATGIRYRKRTYGTGWGTESTVQASAASYMDPTLTVDPDTGDLYCFWIGAPTVNHVYFKRCISETWDTDPTDWITESDTVTGNDRIFGFYSTYGGYKCFIYLTKTGSPYDIKFAFFTALEIRKSSAAVDLAGTTKRSSVLTRMSTATISSLGTSLRKLVMKRFVIASMPLTGIVKRFIALKRTVAAAVDMVSSTKRSLIIKRTVGAAMSLIGSRKRILISIRSRVAALTLTAISKRTFVVARKAIATVMLAASRARLVVLIRFKAATIGIIGSSKRLVIAAREAVGTIDLAGSRVRVKIAIRKMTAGVTVLGNSLRQLVIIRATTGTITSIGNAVRRSVNSRVAAATATLNAVAKRGAQLIAAVTATVSVIANAAGALVGFFVYTLAATGIGQTSAVLRGNVTMHHSMRGFDWGTETGVYTHSWFEDGGFDSGDFEHTIEDLDPHTDYFFRAKAKRG